MEEKEKEKVEEKEKKSSTGIIIILVVIILVLGGFIFINKDKLLGSKEETVVEKEDKNEKEEVIEAVTFTEEELQKYVNYISPVSIGPSAKIYKVDKVVASDLSTIEKIEYIGHAISTKETTTSDMRFRTVTEEDVKKAVEEIYGENTYERVTFNLGCGDYNYHEDDGKFYTITGCGGTSSTFDLNIAIDYKATKTRLEITTAYAFTDAEEKIYKDYDKKEVVEEHEYVEDAVAYLTNYIKENKDKLNHMVYVFESTDGQNYYFKEFHKQ